MKKCKVIVDTNIFIRGWFGKENQYPSCERILQLIDERMLQLIFSQDTIGELVYIMKNAVRYNVDEINVRLSMLQNIMTLYYYSTSVNTKDTNIKFCDDETDDIFLECAETYTDTEYLISDDGNSGIHKYESDKFRVVTSEDFLLLFDE